MIAVAQDGETVDGLCWRVMGRTAGLTEQALRENPGLADLGAKLPGGTLVNLPEPQDAPPAVREIVSLWD